MPTPSRKLNAGRTRTVWSYQPHPAVAPLVLRVSAATGLKRSRIIDECLASRLVELGCLKRQEIRDRFTLTSPL